MNIARIALVLVAILVALPGKITAVDHVVGDSNGWGIPSGGPSTYTNWASQRTFKVGDTLGMYYYVFDTSFSYTISALFEIVEKGCSARKFWINNNSPQVISTLVERLYSYCYTLNVNY